MENESRPHFKPGAIKYTKGFGRKLFVARMIRFIIMLTALFIAGMTIYVYINQPIKTETGYVMANTINRTLKIDENVIIVVTEDYNMFSPLTRFLTNQNVYEAKVVAGPYGEIKTSNNENIIVHADSTVSVNLNNTEKQYLDMEYVVRKIDKEGNIIYDELDNIVNKDEILGLIKIDEEINK